MKTIVHRSKIFTVTLRAVAMLALPCVAAAAGPQSPKAGIEEKKAPQGQTTDERLQQQEERIGELEKRLQEQESAAKSGGSLTAENEAKASAEQPTAAAPVGGRIEVSNEEVRDRRRPLTGGELASEEFPDSWAMFGTDMRMKTGGYLKTHLLYDVDGAADKYQLLMSTIPV